MSRHFFLVFLSLYAEINLAAANDWNCEKNEAGEWSCVTQLPPGQVKKQPSAAVKTEPSVPKVIIKPTPVAKTVENPPAPVVEVEKVETPVAPVVPIVPVNTEVPEIKNEQVEKEIPAPKSDSVKTTKTLAQPLPVIIPKMVEGQSPVPISPKAVSSVVSNPVPEGWTCAANKVSSTWDCNLVGANPKGETKLVSDDENAYRLVDPAFNSTQERAFKNLQKEFPFDPWQQCAAPRQPKQKLVPKKDLRATTPLEIESDYSEVFDKEISSFTGNVEIHRADQHLLADMASYDSKADIMDTQGNVYYSEDGLALFSNSASLQLAADKAVLRNVLFESLSGPFRGSAQVFYKDSKDLSHYNDAAYTSCRPGNQDWVMHTERLKLNKESGIGSATNAWLEFKGLPIIYTPYMNFPIDDRRTSGFLPPSWGSTSRSGFQLTLPFYWNIAPNYDAVLKPRYLQRRGVLLAADARYLTEMTQGSAAIEYMPYDDLRKTARFFGSLKNNTTFLPNLTTDADLNFISDRDYLYELGSALNVSDRRYIKSRANLNYNLEGLSFLAQVERYQIIDNSIERPYQKIPQLNLDLNHSFDSMPIDLTMNNEFVYFYRTGRVSGQRFNTRPSIAFPLSSSGVFATPKLSLQHSQYLLSNQNPGLSNTISRTLPIASLDAGFVLEQPFQIGNSSFLHTIEPRAFYLYVPRSNQDNIPIFDTTFYDFTFGSLFRENRFSGNDRIQDANQVSLALTTRLLDAKTGLEYAKLGLGEILYFSDRKVTLPGFAPETNRLSSFVAELTGNFNDNLSYATGTQWDPHSNQFTRASARLQYAENNDKVFNVGYLYRQNTPEPNQTVPNGIAQTDVSFHWPVYDDWYLMGRWLYALNYNATKESFIGLEKDSCCWRFSIIGRRYSNALSNTVQSQLQTGIFVQLELKGLGSFGDKVDQFLENNISGYLSPHTND